MSNRLTIGMFCKRGHLLTDATVSKMIINDLTYLKCCECSKLYQREKRKNKPRSYWTTRTNYERFISLIKKTDSCWIWNGALNNNGYPMFSKTGGIHILAHRFSYEHFKRPIAQNMQIDHLCNTPSCVNPEHLEQVTNRENTIRAYQRRKASKINLIQNKG